MNSRFFPNPNVIHKVKCTTKSIGWQPANLPPMLSYRKIRLLFIGLISASTLTNFAYAADCVSQACISVQTDQETNSIIITAHQGAPGSSKSSRPKPKIIRPTAKPVPRSKQVYTWIPWKPTPRRVVRIPAAKPRAVIRKPQVTTVASVSLSDQLTQLLPMHRLFRQPMSAALVGIPVNFWTDTNPAFTTVAAILGISVGVNLRPTFTWNFGDGSTSVANQAGASYPSGSITHAYRTPGVYLASVGISWGGTWSAQGNSFPVLGGAITQSISIAVDVVGAPTNYHK